LAASRLGAICLGTSRKKDCYLKGTELAHAQAHTIRLQLLKIGVQIQVTVRRVWISLAGKTSCARLDRTPLLSTTENNNIAVEQIAGISVGGGAPVATQSATTRELIPPSGRIVPTRYHSRRENNLKLESRASRSPNFLKFVRDHG
jgi:hypothetical protein